MSNIDRQDFLEGIKMLSNSINNKIKREVTIPLEEYERYKNKATKYEEALEKINSETALILKNEVEDTNRKYLYDAIYNIYAITCKLWNL